MTSVPPTMTDDRFPPRSAAERYRLRREVASGGMATVYLAEDVVLDRPVALKILTKALAADNAFVDRFRREARAAARFRHPNIVTVYDWGPYQDSFFIAMEYIEGRTLEKVIAEDGPLAPTEAARVAGEIAAALEVAHSGGLVHRDIKPSNIIMTPAGQIRIADFGIARARNAGIDLTQVGMIVGTSAYLSPEQAQGLEVDQRSDLYSLGIVLFEMVTGEPPFHGDSPLAVASQHVSSPAPRLRSRQPSLPVELDELVDRLLAKDPDDRFQSATELTPELRRIQAGEFDLSPPTATPGGDEDQEPTIVMASATGSAPAAMALADDNGRAVPATEIMPESLRPDRRPDPGAPVPVPATRTPESSRPPSRPRSGSTPSGVLVGGAAAMVVAVVAALVFLASGIDSGGLEVTGGATTTPSTGQATSTTQTTEGDTSTVAVPGLVGRSRSEAEQVLSDLGLVPSVQEVEVEDASQAGLVVAQNPQGQQQAETGSTVVIQVGRAASTTTSTTPDPTTTTTTTPTSTTATTVPPQTDSTTVDPATSD